MTYLTKELHKSAFATPHSNLTAIPLCPVLLLAIAMRALADSGIAKLPHLQFFARALKAVFDG